MHKLISLGLMGAVVAGAACGGGAPVPGMSGERESGQSKHMDDTFAGANACSPENHERPFIIEWDATDMSSFEAYAASDVVVVKYEGCKLTILDRCRNDSVRGSLGAYKAVDWTSGSLETIDVESEAELYAKLPLGVASLGGRVKGGEKFHMEYYVAGTRGSTRDGVYTADLEKLPGCQGATHFVYAYNLGAFALGSATELEGEVEGSAYGFSAGGKTSKKKKAEKKGGDLGTCKSDSATEVSGCKAPIRLTLRAVSQGESPEVATRSAADDPASINAAARVDQKIEMSAEARAHYDSAVQKMNAKDGKGCLAELDAHDKLDAKHQSTDPKVAGLAHLRGQCLMLAGKCDAGKEMTRKTFEANPGIMGPEQIDRTVDAFLSLYCQGTLPPREALLRALQELQQGAFMTKKDVKFCAAAWGTARALMPKVKPKDDDDSQVINAPKSAYHMAASCFAKAGDCDAAWKAFREGYPEENLAQVKDPKQKEQIIRTAFESIVSKCKPKE